MNIQLICVGKLKEACYRDAAEEYLKRLTPYCRLTLTQLPEERLPERPSPAQIEAALGKEADAIRSKLPAGAGVVALCVEGRMRSSEELAGMLADWANSGGRPLAFVIGGSYGLHRSIKEQAMLRLSMSPMTFPHHLARVMLLEQIYRAFKINEGSRYHK